MWRLVPDVANQAVHFEDLVLSICDQFKLSPPSNFFTASPPLPSPLTRENIMLSICEKNKEGVEDRRTEQWGKKRELWKKGQSRKQREDICGLRISSRQS